MGSSIIIYQDFKEDLRFDAEYYHTEKLIAEKRLEKFPTSIGDSFKLVRKIDTPKSDEDILAVDLENIFKNRINNVKSVKGWELGSAKKTIKKDDVIISRLRSYLKQIAINYNYEKLFGSTEFIVLRKKPDSKINKEFLFIFLLSNETQDILKWSQEGSNHPRFSQSLLSKIRIPTPTKTLQKTFETNIIKSNECFILADSKYKEAVKIIESELNLNKIQTHNDHITVINHNDFISEFRFDAQYFSSQNLKSIFSGKFHSKPLKQLCEKIETGLTPAKDSYWQKGYPVLKMGCLTNSGIDWLKIEFANESYFKKAKKYSIEEEDIILTSSAHALEHIAKKVDIVADIPDEYKNKLVFVGEVLRLRIKKELINPYYLLLFLKTEIGYKLLQNCIRGQTAHIYPKDIENIVIPLIPSKKQEKIEKLLKESHKLMKESTNLINKSIKEVEELIENEAI